jgi:ATP-dependent helicase HrpA
MDENLRNKLQKIESLLPKALLVDRYKIGREIARIKRSKAKAPSVEKINKKLFLLEKKLQKSIEKRSWRKINRPEPIYNEALPILSKKDDIIDTISNNPVVIISGETGSGKTTQIPKFCLAAGCGIDGKIGCTQPRRIAAMTVSKRIAEEFGETLGNSVGYKIRFKDKTSPNAFIKIMTDGILLAETQNDPYLTEYDTIIVDEAHERSLNIDFILGILKTLLKKRIDLKVIITSATIDTEKFSKAFEHAPVIEVSGRMYPVEVRYLPMQSIVCLKRPVPETCLFSCPQNRIFVKPVISSKKKMAKT